jgi:Zn-finger nucleic acid-binding protein
MKQTIEMASAAYKNEDQCGCCGVSLTSSELDKIVDSKYNQCPYCQGVVI